MHSCCAVANHSSTHPSPDACGMMRYECRHHPQLSSSPGLGLDRFMGLMLATMLPRDEAVLIAVHDAVGTDFINRLVLGLSVKQHQV